MADTSVTSGASATTPPPRQQGGWRGGIFQQIVQSLLIYFVMTNIFTFFKQKSPNEILSNSNHFTTEGSGENSENSYARLEKPTEFQTALMGVNPNAHLPVFPTRDSEGRKLGSHKCLFRKGMLLDFYLFITEDNDFNYEQDFTDKLIWNVTGIPYNSSFAQYPAQDINLTVTDHMLHNGSVTAHVFFAKSSSPIDVADESYDPDDVAYQKFDLIRYRKKKIPKKTYKLLESLGKQQDLESTSDNNRDELLALPVSSQASAQLSSSAESLISVGEQEAKSSTQLTAVASADIALSEAEDGQIVPYWVPTLDLVLVEDMPDAFGRNAIPSAILQHLSFNEMGNYYPVIYHNDFFLTTKHLIEVNHTVGQFPRPVTPPPLDFISSHLNRVSAFASVHGVHVLHAVAHAEPNGTKLEVCLPLLFSLWTQDLSLLCSCHRRQQELGTGSDRDTDMIREVLFDTNPWLLGITFAVSLLHTLFDILAFKNDIQFWRKKKSMAGTSVQSLGVNCFFQTVIFLYLMDNDTSWMILFSSGIGLLIEYWKLTKAFNVTFHRRGENLQLTSTDPPHEEDTTASPSAAETSPVTSAGTGMKLKIVNKIFGIPLPFQMRWKLSDSYTTSKTREYDAIATVHLLYVVIPIVFGYSIYSLIHISHKSFYSWFLGSLVGFVYAFGFVLMTPQLFINYKLKSVAHMPWKAMVYKSLNTFIDDLFAFVIKMPLMHRLACFRDDIIFFIYLYQRWIYAVDMSRVNEFGQGGEDGSDAVTNGSEGSNRSEGPPQREEDKVSPHPTAAGEGKEVEG